MRGQADQVRAGQDPTGVGGGGVGGQERTRMGAPKAPSHTLPRASPPSHLTLHFSEIILIHCEHFMGRDCSPRIQ